MRVFGTSIPKAGTHFLAGIFESLGFSTMPCRKDRTGVGHLTREAMIGEGKIYAFGHWRCHEPHISLLREHGYKVIVLIRDPRDMLLSMADYYRAGNPVSLIKRRPYLQQMTQKELVLNLIKGISTKCQGWLEWRESGGVVVKYEDLAYGRPLTELTHIGLDPMAFHDAALRSFGSASKTLNTGRSERWRSEFDEGMLEHWHQHAAGTAALLGYAEG